MQIKLFTLSAFDGEAEEATMNKFLRAHRILRVEKQFMPAGLDSYWCFCVEYQAGGKPNAEDTRRKAKIDYRDHLSEEAFSRFARLREVRKTIAREQGVPAYAVFTNKELAQLAELEKLSLEQMQSLEGIGAKRAEKYGPLFLQGLSHEA
jgi:superfamily II DNA helicase RecQ